MNIALGFKVAYLTDIIWVLFEIPNVHDDDH